MGIEIEGQVMTALPKGLHLTLKDYEQGIGKPSTKLADAIIDSYNAQAINGHFEPETPEGSVEYVGEVVESFEQFQHEFRLDMETLLLVLKEHKATMLWTGTHPVASIFAPARESYRRSAQLSGVVSRMFSIHANFSLKALLQIRGWEGVISALNALHNFYPLIAGMCANSPAANGAVCAASTRTWLRSGTRFGPPPIWESIEQLASSSNLLLDSGLVTDVHQKWSMGRIKFLPKSGISLKKSQEPINLEDMEDIILEVRCPDAAISPMWAQIEFAFLLALTEYIVGALIEGKPLPTIPAEDIRQENLYQAWVGGLKANMIVRAQAEDQKALAVKEAGGIAYYKKSTIKGEVLRLLDEHLLPIAQMLGCEEELRYLRKQVTHGRNGAAIQLAVVKKYGDGEQGVMGLLEWLMKRPFTRGFLPR